MVRESDVGHVPVVEEPMPIGTVDDEVWAEEVAVSNEVARVTTKHLDYESRGRLLMDLDDFQPKHLCPEQRVELVSDLYRIVMG